MIPLKAKGIPNNIHTTHVSKVISVDKTSFGNERVITYINNDPLQQLILFKSGQKAESISENGLSRGVYNIEKVDHLQRGDIISITPNGMITTLFRIGSQHNNLFITERCNSNCLMCSQPPKNKDDLDYFLKINSSLVKMMPRSTQNLGITGGEPLLLGSNFIVLLKLISETLPDTEIHILSNGRAFAWKNIPFAISQLNNPKIIFGVPLYSDYYLDHDYIVQAKNAFNQTIIGLHNIARFNIRLEIRIVLHKLTYKRLLSLAKFIYHNLPFVEHVALMGLEFTGYTPFNEQLLWIEPSQYQDQLEEATLYLDAMNITVSIYNIPLCLLKKSLWKYSRKSISDWKKENLPECLQCAVFQDCGGIFATSKKQSNEIKAFIS